MPEETPQETTSEVTETGTPSVMAENVQTDANEPVQEKPKVTVDEGALKNVVDRLEKLEKENEMLRSVADKGRVANWEERNKGTVRSKVLLSTYNGKVLTGWKTTMDLVEKNEQGVWREKQEIEAYTEDGETIQLPMRAFLLNVIKIPAEVQSRSETADDVIFKVKAENGREYEISHTFIN